MKIIKPFTRITLLMIFSIAICLTSIEANQGSQEIRVTYSPYTIYQRIEFCVNISGKGSVKDEGSILREGMLVYQLQDKDQKTFYILPDAGFHIEQITLDNGYEKIDISNRIEGNKLDLTMKDKNARLHIEFKKTKMDHKPGDVNTKDTTNKQVLLYFIIGSLGILVGCCLMKHKQKEK